jgi:hypothetical protein
MSDRSLATVVLDGLDNAWQPLVERTAHLSEQEFRWEPAANCWTVRDTPRGWHVDWADPDPDPAPVTTIAWRTWHIAVDALDSYSARLFDVTGTSLAGTAWVEDWASAKPLMDAAWSVFRAGVAGWGDDLFQQLGPAWGPFAEHVRLDLVVHAQREVIHHGAEIALLCDLYRAHHH